MSLASVNAVLHWVTLVLHSVTLVLHWTTLVLPRNDFLSAFRVLARGYCTVGD